MGQKNESLPAAGVSRPPCKQPAFIRALRILEDHREGLYPVNFYELMWPTGDGGNNSTKGGPCGQSCAANWLLGRVARKYPNSCVRYAFLDQNRIRAGRWFIQTEGRRILNGKSLAQETPAGVSPQADEK